MARLTLPGESRQGTGLRIYRDGDGLKVEGSINLGYIDTFTDLLRVVPEVIG